MIANSTYQIRQFKISPATLGGTASPSIRLPINLEVSDDAAEASQSSTTQLALLRSGGNGNATADLSELQLLNSLTGSVRPTSAPIDDDDLIAAMRPIERWKYLAQKRKSTFFLFLLSTLAWLYAVTSSWSGVSLTLSNLVSVAMASETIAPVAPSSTFSMQDVFLVLLTLFVLWSLLTVTFAKSGDKVKLAGDALKTLLGFVVGFFGNHKAT